jgi:hypothetical protein
MLLISFVREGDGRTGMRFVAALFRASVIESLSEKIQNQVFVHSRVDIVAEQR